MGPTTQACPPVVLIRWQSYGATNTVVASRTARCCRRHAACGTIRTLIDISRNTAHSRRHVVFYGASYRSTGTCVCLSRRSAIDSISMVAAAYSAFRKPSGRQVKRRSGALVRVVFSLLRWPRQVLFCPSCCTVLHCL